MATTTSNAIAAVMPAELAEAKRAECFVEHEQGEPDHDDRDKGLHPFYTMVPEQRQQHDDTLAQDSEERDAGETRKRLHRVVYGYASEQRLDPAPSHEDGEVQYPRYLATAHPERAP